MEGFFYKDMRRALPVEIDANYQERSRNSNLQAMGSQGNEGLKPEAWAWYLMGLRNPGHLD